MNKSKRKRHRMMRLLLISLVIGAPVYALQGIWDGQVRRSDDLAAAPVKLPSVGDETVSSDDQSRLYGQYDRQGGYLLAWLKGSSYAGYGGYDIVVGKASVANPGEMSKATTLRIPDSQEEVAMALGSAGALIVWQDLRSGKDYDVYAARVGDDGTVLDRGGVLVAGGQHNQINPSVVFDGQGFVVAWADFDGRKYNIVSATVSASGTVGRKTTLVSFPDSHALRPYLMKAENGVWLFWAEARAVNNLKAKNLTTGESYDVSKGFLMGKYMAATDGRYVLLVLSLLQSRGWDPTDVVGMIFDTKTQRVVLPDKAKAALLYRIGPGPAKDILWFEDSSNRNRKRPHVGNIRGVNAAFDGEAFQVVWSTVLFGNSPKNQGQAINHQIWRQKVDPATGAFLEPQPKLLVESQRPLRNPLLVSTQKGVTSLAYDTETADGTKIIKWQ